MVEGVLMLDPIVSVAAYFPLLGFLIKYESSESAHDDVAWEWW
jgi:hypothetical protein